MVETDASAKGCAKEECHCAGKGGGLAVRVENRAGAKVGDTVSILFKPGAVFNSVLILLGIPFAGILAGVILGTALDDKASPTQAFLAGTACVALSITAAALVYRRVASRLQPYVDRVLTSGAGAGAFVDPVCGKAIDPLSAAAKIDYEGRTYHFCRAGCLDAFIKDPRRYAGSLGCAQCGGKL